MTTTNELSVTPNLVVSRESFEKAVEELEALVREGEENHIVGDPASLTWGPRYAAARSRLLHLWDDQQAEVERLRDDPECDATDLAHPAWWRGNDAGVHATVEVIRRVLDSGLDGGVSGYKPLQEIRERIERLRESQRDTERLDWLDDRENFYAITPATNMIGGPHGWTYYVGRPRFDSIGERCFDLRDAIDKARLKSGSPREERSDG